MTAPKAYTPLEKLLLVQQLNEDDPNAPSFEKISESLKKNAYLRESMSYDPNRFNPEALTQLYLLLMKEEAKLEVERAESARDGRDGGRNRHRLMSPLLETVSEASRHTKLIPLLLDRVYSLYKNHAIKEIQYEESKFISLEREIEEINRGEWDARMQLEAISPRRDAKEGLKSIQTTALRHEPDREKNRSENVLQSAKIPPRNGESAAPQNQEPKGLVDLSIGNAVKPQVEPPIVEVPKEKPIVLETAKQPEAPSLQPPEESKGLPNVEVTASPQVPPKSELQQLPELVSTVTSPPIALPKKVIPSAPPWPAQNSGFPPNSPGVNQSVQHPPASPDVANQPVQHPSASPDVNQPVQHPTASPAITQPVQHPPASPIINQPVSHPPASSDVNRQIPSPAPFLDANQRKSYQPPSPDVNKRNPQLPPSPDTSHRIPHHPISPATNQQVSFPPPQPQAVAPSSASPHPQKLSVPSPDRSPQSPITLPPLAGVLRSTVSPLVPLETLADMAGQQPYKQSNPIRGGHPAVVQPHPIQLPTPRNYPVPLYPYYDTQQSYGAPYSPYGHSPMPSYHRVTPHSMPPYQGTASSPGRGPVYGNVPYYPHPTPSYSQYAAYSSQSPSFPQTPQNQFNRNPAPRFHDIHTPLPGGSGRSRPPRPSPINTSTTSTRWKNVELPGSVRSPTSPERPGPGEISPLSEKSPSPFPETLPETFPQETFPHQSMQIDSPTSTKGRGRGGRGRARGRGKSGSVRGRGRGGRAGSTVPTAPASTIPDSAHARTRSHSILSHTEDAPIDSRTSTKPDLVATPSDNKISTKHELVATPSDNKTSTKPKLVATPVADEDSPATETTMDEESRQSVRQSTRPRRATLRSLDNADLDLASKKRKLTPPESPVRSPSPSSSSNISRPNFILGSRNFARTSATIMNDISAHKLASLFAKPLTDRDAPGYKNLIYRPQDLKSLKSAIGAGGRALAAAVDGSSAADAGSPLPQQGSMTSSNNARSSTVWIPATVDVVPPKGIVNSAQLEKELMRMFANAVMFNPDPKRGFGPAFRERSGRDHHYLQLGESGLADHNDKSREEEEHPAIAADDEEEGGVVKDAREMFAAVERSVTNWRAAERVVENSATAAAAAAAAIATAAGAGPLGSGSLLGSALKGSMARLRGGADESAEAGETGGGGVGADEEGLDEDITGGKRKRR
ncbi:hypothetical protein MMC31_002085 [Peltigera leucophlebia]|nr:hypothetical protein [Peltigera leucophlebia]